MVARYACMGAGLLGIALVVGGFEPQARAQPAPVDPRSKLVGNWRMTYTSPEDGTVDAGNVAVVVPTDGDAGSVRFCAGFSYPGRPGKPNAEHGCSGSASVKGDHVAVAYDNGFTLDLSLNPRGDELRGAWTAPAGYRHRKGRRGTETWARITPKITRVRVVFGDGSPLDYRVIKGSWDFSDMPGNWKSFRVEVYGADLPSREAWLDHAAIVPALSGAGFKFDGRMGLAPYEFDVAKGSIFLYGTLFPGAAPGKHTFTFNGASSTVDVHMVHQDDLTTALVLYDRYDRPIDTVAGFSRPFPTVELDPIRRTGLLGRIKDSVARIRVKGTVRDALADVVAEHAADIKSVTIEFRDAKTSVSRASVTVPVVRDASAQATRARPFAFLGRFEAEVAVPLSPGDVEVAVKAVNLVGGTGYDSFSVRVHKAALKEVTVNGVTERRPVVNDDAIETVINHDSTRPGLFNPITIRLEGTFSEPPPGSIKVRNRDLPLVPDGNGRYAVDRPLVALFGDVPAGIPNLVPLSASLDPTRIDTGGGGLKLEWTYTSHSPPARPMYAAGTVVQHDVRGKIFERLGVRGATSVKAMMSDKGGWHDDDTVRILDVRALPRDGLGAPGVRVTLSLGGDALRSPEKQLGIYFYDLQDNQPFGHGFYELGEFLVVPMRTVIIGVDGLAYCAAARAMALPASRLCPSLQPESAGGRPPPDAPTFRRLFGNAAHSDAPALSALPSITWANWSGIISGSPPARHGVMGNSFFARERWRSSRRESESPFNCNSTGSMWDNLEAVFDGFNDLAKNDAGSVYDDLRRAAKQPLRSWSINMWYYRGEDVTAEHYFNPEFRHHSPEAARGMDESSGSSAVSVYEHHRDDAGVVTVYFPGPDNVAHAVGASAPQGGYSAGPPVGQVREPLKAIAEHLAGVTDPQLARLVRAIDDTGYLHATLFVLVADHGLHAFANDADHNLYVADLQVNHNPMHRVEPASRTYRGLGKFFEDIGRRVWQGSGDVDAHDLVYAANGGLAELHVKATGSTWRDPTPREQIERVAARIFIQVSHGSRFEDCKPGMSAPESRPCRVVPGPDILASGSPLGNPPAIFLRPDLNSDFLWLKSVSVSGSEDQARLVVETASVRDFIDARKALDSTFEWPELDERIKELNDGRSSNRVGEILLFPDGKEGYLTVNQGDGLNGWHGGATESESYVPLMFGMADSAEDAVVDVGFLKTAVDHAAPAGGRMFRNWEMKRVLTQIYVELGQRKAGMR